MWNCKYLFLKLYVTYLSYDFDDYEFIDLLKFYNCSIIFTDVFTYLLVIALFQNLWSSVYFLKDFFFFRCQLHEDTNFSKASDLESQTPQLNTLNEMQNICNDDANGYFLN